MQQTKNDGYKARVLLQRLVQSTPFKTQNNSAKN
jgi:hypothetical protein